MAQKPSIPKGTRDFLPDVMVRRNYIFDTIKGVFKRFGFQPIETPSMENLSTLLGKYGEEGDKLLFRILNSGDFMSGVEQNGEALQSEKIAGKICEKGLRYDLTVPFARFVVQYRDQIAFPFRRYQIQPVWRADRPQKGRYREFYQCDVDIVGSNSILNEAELVQIVDEVFNALKINVVLKINNRKVLAGIAEYIGKPDALVDITVAIDKLDKIGIDAVKAALAPVRADDASSDMCRSLSGVPVSAAVSVWHEDKKIASHEGEVLDLAVEVGIVDKSGAWYSYNGEKIGQGRENAKELAKEYVITVEEVVEPAPTPKTV